MELPSGYQTSVKLRATGSLPPTQLDATGKFVAGGVETTDAKASKENAAPVVEERKDKKSYCIDLLIEGCVDSFVDFLKITHNAPGAEAVGGGEKKAGAKKLDIVYLKDTLEKAETNRRAMNYNTAVDGYNGLAEYFDKIGETKSSRYFFERCIAVAQEAGASDALAKANLNMGMCEEKLLNWEAAMGYHETALELSSASEKTLPLQIKSAFQLCTVYKILAEKYLASKTPSLEEIRAASDLFEKCVACAKLAKDAKLEGQNCHQLGKVKILYGEYDESIRLQKQYLEFCERQKDRSGEANARAALAQAYEALGHTKEAMNQLERLLVVAAEAGEVEAQAQACLNLGLLYGEDPKAITLLERHFKLVTELQDRDLIDAARVILGMTKGKAQFGQYMNLVQNDLRSLLAWKTRREPIPMS
ncbi:unnamed protein product [Amoebophrya sp. A25]|nr:unnamed protein product [Amoebophrya sp. A25]|eukprot:GSA25T00004944001.1